MVLKGLMRKPKVKDVFLRLDNMLLGLIITALTVVFTFSTKDYLVETYGSEKTMLWSGVVLLLLSLLGYYKINV